MSSNDNNKEKDKTIEFFNPGNNLDLTNYIQAEDKQGIHHLGRYFWAKEVLARENKGMRILDIACGAGYGSYILARDMARCSVMGADYDIRAIELARSGYRLPSLDFVVADITNWEVADTGDSLGEFDCVISFDTIEHCIHREIALMNIANNLADDGLLLFSTPCGHDKTRLNPEWEHHKIEYSHDALFDFISRYFREIYKPDDGSLPCLGFWQNKINKGKVRYPNVMNPLVCKLPIRIQG